MPIPIKTEDFLFTKWKHKITGNIFQITRYKQESPRVDPVFTLMIEGKVTNGILRRKLTLLNDFIYIAPIK